MSIILLNAVLKFFFLLFASFHDSNVLLQYHTQTNFAFVLIFNNSLCAVEPIQFVTSYENQYICSDNSHSFEEIINTISIEKCCEVNIIFSLNKSVRGLNSKTEQAVLVPLLQVNNYI